MSVKDVVDALINWVPYLILLLPILICTLTGLRRGLRKSAILLTHNICITVLCLIVFVLCVENEKVDAFLLETINFIMGSDTWLQRQLSVDSSCETLREVILEFIPSQLSLDEGIKLILKDNGAYILTLVNLVFHIIFALILSILRSVLIIVMYIIYLIFYSERKHRRKTNKKMIRGETPHTYKRRRLAGACLGFSKGLIVGLLMLSSLASIYFIAAGGSGEEERANIDFGDGNINEIYGAYQEFSTYGTKGIFKVLNAFKDNDNSPIYLYAADLIMSGGLKDETHHIEENIVLRKEFALYVDFANDILSLASKCCDGDLGTILNSPNALDEILKIMSKEEFQKEFDMLIEDFDSSAYFVAFAVSLMDSALSHLDELDLGLSENIVDLLSILFKDGYLSDSIPYEKALLEERNKSEDKTNKKYYLDNLSILDVVNKDNIKIFYKLFIDIFNYTNIDSNSKEDMVNLVDSIVDYTERLSLFDKAYSEKLNNVYRRLFAYIDYNVLNGKDLSGGVSRLSTSDNSDKYYSGKYITINWLNEIEKLLELARNAMHLYSNLASEEAEIIDIIFSIYDKNDKNYRENVDCFEEMLNYISDSEVISILIASNYLNSMITNTISSIVPDYKMPEDIQFSNSYHSNGKLMEYGELHYLLEIIKSLISNQTLKDVIKAINSEESVDTTDVMFTLIDELLVKDTTLIDSFVESKLARSIFSGIIIETFGDGSDLSIYIDDSLFELSTSGEKLNIINKDEFRAFAENISLVLELILPIVEEGFSAESLVSLLGDDRILSLLDSKIIEGTISSLLVENLSDMDMIVLPNELLNGYGYISTSAGDSEVKKLVEVFVESEIDFSVLFGAETGTEGEDDPIISMLKDFDEKQIRIILNSKIMHYSFSNFITSRFSEIIEGFEIIVPNAARTSLMNESIHYVIEKEAFVDFLVNMLDFINGDDFSDVNHLISMFSRKCETYVDDLILGSTMVNYFVNHSSFADNMHVPDLLMKGASPSKLINYDANNVWHDELINIMLVLDEILNISENEDFNIDDLDALENGFIDALNNINGPSKVEGLTKLELLYQSKIAASNLTNVLYQNILTDDIIDKSVKKNDKVYDYAFEAIRSEEVSNLIATTQILGLEFTMDNFNTSDFINKLSSFTKEERSEIYKSYLFMGIVSHALVELIDTTDGVLMHTSYAYYDDIDIYKDIEFEALFELLGDKDENGNTLLTRVLNKSESLNLNSFDILHVKDILYDFENNETKSYLLSYAISNMILDIDQITIPESEYMYSTTREQFIKPFAIAQLIDGVFALGCNDFEFTLEGLAFPSDDALETAADSEILRASLTKMLKISSNFGESLLNVENRVEYRVIAKDYIKNNLIYLSHEEFVNTFKALKKLFGENEAAYSISINLDTIFNVAKMTDEDKDVILSSNVIKMIVNDYFNEDGIKLGFININYEFFNINAATVECCNITNRRIYKADVATKEQLLNTLKLFNEQFNGLFH